MNIIDLITPEKTHFNVAVPPVYIKLSPPLTVEDGNGDLDSRQDALSVTSTDYEIVLRSESSLESSDESSDSEDDWEKDVNLIAWKSSDCRYEL